MKLKHQIFLSTFVAAMAVSFSVFLILEWDLYRNHFILTKTINRVRLANLAVGLKDVYVEHGSWDAVGRDAALRKKLLLDTLSVKANAEGQGNILLTNPPIPRPIPYGPNGLHFDNSVVLLDSEKNQIFGPLIENKQIEFLAISHQEKVIGYLGMIPINSLVGGSSPNFRTQQAILSIALAAFVISISISVPLANRLIQPISTLATAHHDLASGDYDTRVEINAGGELGQLAHDFNNLALALEKHRKTRCQYAADVSHELRTSLTILRAESEAIVEGVRQTTPGAIAALHGEVLQLSRLVEDIYQLSVTDIGALSYYKKIQPVADILSNTVTLFKTNFVIKEIELQVNIQEPSNFQVHADGDRLHQLFCNLLKNSLQYTDLGGMLAIQMKCQDNVATIDFLDSAPGVPLSDKEHVFDRFFRVDKSRSRKTGGAGLGLAICKNIVEAHDGSISAIDSPLGGLWIKVELPLIEGKS